MKFFFSILIIALSFSANCQEKNYLEYHKNIAKAEESLVNEKFQDALVLYEKSFSNRDFVFAKDAFVACQISGYLNQKNKFDTLLILCIKQGVTMSLLKKAQWINKYISSDSAKYNALYSKYRNVYYSKINLKLRNEFHSRFNEEQDAKYLPGVAYYRNVVTNNYKRIEELAKAGTFPGERVIGIDYGITHSLNRDMNIDNGFTYATLLHYPYAYSKLEKYLLEAIENGITTPRQVEELYGFEQNRTGVLYDKSAKYDSLKYVKSYGTFGYSSKDKDAINSYREALGLCTLETDEKKIAFAKKFHFIGI